LDVLKEIGNVITTNTETIEKKLKDLTNTEKVVIFDVINEIKGKYPKIYEEIDWRNLLQYIHPGRVEKLNDLIKMSEHVVRFKNRRKRFELTSQLKSHIGSIKGDAPEKAIRVEENKLRKYTKSNPARKSAWKRIHKFNKGLQFSLRQTIQYEEVSADITRLIEELEERVVEEDEREGALNKFKERLEKILKCVIVELKKLEVEEKTEEEELEDEEIEDELEFDELEDE